MNFAETGGVNIIRSKTIGRLKGLNLWQYDIGIHCRTTTNAIDQIKILTHNILVDNPSHGRKQIILECLKRFNRKGSK